MFPARDDPLYRLAKALRPISAPSGGLLDVIHRLPADLSHCLLAARQGCSHLVIKVLLLTTGAKPRPVRSRLKFVQRRHVESDLLAKPCFLFPRIVFKPNAWVLGPCQTFAHLLRLSVQPNAHVLRDHGKPKAFFCHFVALGRGTLTEILL